MSCILLFYVSKLISALASELVRLPKTVLALTVGHFLSFASRVLQLD
jgi:hypothetical protein